MKPFLLNHDIRIHYCRCGCFDSFNTDYGHFKFVTTFSTKAMHTKLNI